MTDGIIGDQTQVLSIRSLPLKENVPPFGKMRAYGQGANLSASGVGFTAPGAAFYFPCNENSIDASSASHTLFHIIMNVIIHGNNSRELSRQEVLINPTK